MPMQSYVNLMFVYYTQRVNRSLFRGFFNDAVSNENIWRRIVGQMNDELERIWKEAVLT
jgi:hypothetical protein